MKNILITGCAGFIGFSFSKRLLKSKKYKVYGLDNINSYYSIKLKKKRLSILKKFKNFEFEKIDITNKNKLKKYFQKNKFDIIFHFAAQAGVRYVSTNPEKFIESNILGFHNLIEISKAYNVKKFFYSSSSSVYGDAMKFPINENFDLNPKNIYGLSKKFNEEYININSNKNTKYIGLRFFTVYGEWGRPDMLILKFLKTANENKFFYLNNNGKYWRDFTYIDDIVKILEILLIKKIKNNQIFNLCRGKPEHIKTLISYISKKVKFNKIKKINHNQYEVLKTHGDNKKIIKFTGYKKFTNMYNNLPKIITWYQKYKNLI